MPLDAKGRPSPDIAERYKEVSGAALKIQDYAIIGDCRSAALVSRSGSLDWLCWPRFDSPSVFAALLDPDAGGRWSIVPAQPFWSERRYCGNSNVLQTWFHTETGAATLTDLMPVASEEFKNRELLPDHEIIRELECKSGTVEIEFHLQPRLNYGANELRIRPTGKLGLRMDVPGGVYWLRSTHPLEASDGRVRTRLQLRAADKAQFSFIYAEESPVVLPPLGDWTTARILRSIEWWEQWAARARYDGSHRDAVIRSALTLKLLTYAPSGAIVAAPTTSLPERVGGDLNWDYRYCWLRDASLTVRSLLGLGYYEEADAFLNWLLHATALTQPELRILYTVFGENAPPEHALPHLRGYRDSRPVRVGNAARGQLQLDVYGEVIDAAAQYLFHGGSFDRATQKRLRAMGQYVARHWRQPDEGIWEPREGRAHHTHSRLLCWTALDRLIRFADRGLVEKAPVEEFTRQRQAIFHDIKQNAWSERLCSYSAVLGADVLDASLLLISWHGFEEAASQRMRLTRRALRDRLGARNGLLYRYRPGNGEGAFGICGFWDVECLALGAGTLDEANELFKQLISCANDLGLFAEEVDPETGDALGNFPQAFTHIGLISAALSLSARERGQPQLPHRALSAEQAQKVVS